jgi:hypothetical protein
MKILVACEMSGVVRTAFESMGHNAVSCDILPTEIPGPHYQGDVFDIIAEGWDMMIAFPPCTHLAVSGAAWFAEKRKDGRQAEGISFFMRLATYPGITKICIENPVGIMSTHFRKPDQIIQPWQFGHGETKATCFWLKGLQKLQPTNIVDGREQRLHRLPPSKDRVKIRSMTFCGVARAMAEQWGSVNPDTDGSVE